VSETGERMKGGAVKDDKSPENEAILHVPVPQSDPLRTAPQGYRH
jgi:hypothetical protein